jgi:hypothetical protein
MRLTIRHRFDFGADRELVGDDLVRPEAWDALRTRSGGPFALAGARAELERAAGERPDIEARARAIDAWLEQRAVRRLASYGVGGALLELWLLRLRPERELVLTDYAPATVSRVRELFPDAEVLGHNLLTDPPVVADLHLFHRIDTEFTNREWRRILERFAALPVLVVATEVIDLRRVVAELWAMRHGRSTTRAGWIRTRGAFEALWRPTHAATPLRFHDLEAWALEPPRDRVTSRA